MFKNLTINNIFILVSSFFFLGCTNSSLKPISQSSKIYEGEATLLVAVDGTDGRAIRHIVIGTNEEPLGYEVYFHDKKIEEGLISITIPTPSTNVHVSEYSLTGMYGCSRGKAGYGKGSKSIATIHSGTSYFLGTINTSMNTTYNEMPDELIKEAKTKYNYTAKGKDIAKNSMFKSRISL